MISLVTAYYKNEDMTVQFLDNLVGKLPNNCEVILVNAGSEPIEHPVVTKRVDLDHNESFSNSMNAGIKAATGRHVCVIGNDVFPQTVDWLDRLVEAADANPTAMIVSPTNTLTDLHNYSPVQLGGSPHYIVTMFPAVCWLLPRETIDTIGLFDERFIPGCYEDDDYIRRVHIAGGEVLVDTSVVVKHLLSKTLGLLDANQAMIDNHKRFIDKWENQ